MGSKIWKSGDFCVASGVGRPDYCGVKRNKVGHTATDAKGSMSHNSVAVKATILIAAGQRGVNLRALLTICMLTFGLLAPAVKAQEKLPLKLIVTTPLPGFTGDLDHFGVDLRGGRLFLASEVQKTVEVFDLYTGKRTHSIKGFGQPLTMAYLADSDRLIVTDGGDTDAVHLVDCKEYKIINTLKLGPGVDHGVYNPVDKNFYVENGGGPESKTHVLSIIDTNSFKTVGEVAGLPGNSNEGMVIDHAGKKLYVNLTGSDEIGVIDLTSRQLVARWPLPDAHVAHAIALDEPNHRLFTAARKPAEFIVFNIDTGKVVSTLPCVGVNSDMSLDVAHKRIYVTGTETATVIEQRDADHYEHIAEVATAYRAKSSIFVPQLKRLYIADSGKGKPDAKLALQIFEVQ
jgi:DNA-binding beta-propeller fold protein YncE